MNVRVVTDVEAFRSLQPGWKRLHNECATGDPFLSYEWFDAAWQWARQRGELYVMCCEHDGELLGVLPMFRARRSAAKALGKQTLEFLAVPDTQRCDVLASSAQRGRVVAAFADALVDRQSDWDVLRLRYLHERTVALTVLEAVLGERRFRCDVKAGSPNPWISLREGWDAYYAMRSRSTKKAVNLAANRLARAGAVTIEWLAPGTGDILEVYRVVETATRISSRSWKVGTGTSLDNAGPSAFIRRLAEHAHGRGWLSIWTLSLDGQPVAMEFQLVDRGNVFALRSDFDAARDDLSPGSHLSRRMIEDLFGSGLERYFMGPGKNPYKYRWAEGSDPVLAMTVYGHSLHGCALAAWELAVRPVARRVYARIRPGGRVMSESADPVAFEKSSSGR